MMQKVLPDYDALFHINPLPTLVFDASNYTIADANKAATDCYGYTLEEFLPLRIQDLFYQPTEQNLQLLHTYSQQERSTPMLSLSQLQHQKKNGAHMQVQMTAQKMVNDGHAYVMLVVQVVSESILQNHNLRAAEATFTSATATAKLGYWRLEMDGSYASWSDEMYNIWGRSKANFEINYANFLETIHPGDRAYFEKEQAASLAGLQEHNVVHRILMPNGAIKWVQELGRLVRDASGNPVAFEGTSQDVTAQKLEKQHLRLLESVITNTTDAIIITDAESLDSPGPRILYVNEAFTKMTGYTAEEVIGKTPRILQGPDSDPETVAMLSQALRKWQPTQITLLNYKKNGDEFWINMAINPVADENGWFSHWIAIERDVTEEEHKKLELALLSKINLIFSEEPSVKAAVQQVCKAFADFARFDIAEIWLPNIEGDKISLTAKVNETEASDLFYKHAGDTQKFAIDEGLAFRVWQTMSPILWSGAEIEHSFVRIDAARNAGLRSVLGIPLLYHDKLVGVLIIGSVKASIKLAKYSNILQQLETFIGLELNRKVLETDLSHLFEALPDIICTTNFSGRVLRMNKAGCILLGYKEEEILGELCSKFQHPEDVESSIKELSRLITGESLVQFENRCVSSDHQVIWLSWTCNSDLSTGLIYASAKDITREKKLWLINQQANQLAKIGSWEVDLNSNRLYWSDMVYEIYEADPQSYQPEIATSIQSYRPDFVTMVEQEVGACMQHCRPFDFEAMLLTANNNERWVRVIGNAEQIDGTCKRIYGSIQDIHHAKTLHLQLEETLGSISDAFYALDSNWNFTYFNKEAERILNLKAADIIGKNKWQQFPQMVGTQMETVYRRVAQRGEAEIFEYYYPVSEQWFEVNTYPSQGGVSSYFKNITDRKQSAVLMQKAFAEKTMILESIGDAFFTVDKNFTVNYWNHKAEALLSTKREDVLGKNLWDVFPDAVNLPSYNYYYEAIKKNTTFAFEDFFADKHIEVNAYPSDNGLTVFFRDISERKQFELQILAANERFEKATQATNDAIWDWNIIDDTMYWSGGFKSKFGYEGEKVTATLESWIERIHPEDFEEVLSGVNKVINDPLQQIWQSEYRYKREDGTYAHVMDRGVTIRNEAGKAVRMIGAMTDISDRKIYEAQLVELNKSLKKYTHDLEVTNEQLEQFAFIASHDLQEPLRMIASFLNQLKKKYSDQIDEKGQQYIHFATDGAKRMKQIILDLLEYSRAGKFQENFENINLETVLEDFKLLRRNIIAELNANIISPDLPVVMAYKAPFVQVIHCLLDNALKYSKKETAPVIEVKVVADGDAWLFSIADNGLGIEQQFFDKIFIIFQRLHNREEYSGTGIGLAIVKKHIEGWGGKIWLSSTLGEGTTFYFTMPVSPKVLEDTVFM